MDEMLKHIERTEQPVTIHTSFWGVIATSQQQQQAIIIPKYFSPLKQRRKQGVDTQQALKSYSYANCIDD